MFGKLTEAKAKIEAVKENLDSIVLIAEGASGKIKITVTATKKIKDIEINADLLTDKEALQDYLINTLNNALDMAEHTASSEMQKVYNEMMPGMGGLANMLGK